ncbi:hypothetical protein [Candidatus Vondammii sp. HM_W22]|uniref:hypothetical protein n=1 Tax=Candidatus Vondammii sp. HM_W22 TaxID=2687299 RepID=UPI001F13A43D|nr:hypothetical protein [Candidatus Vondammii sp. HM_W22]
MGTTDNPLAIKEFIEVMEVEIARHNADEGRKTPVCQGRSFKTRWACRPPWPS